MATYGLRPMSILEGSISEDQFSKILQKKGWSVIPSDRELQYKHVDFILTKENVQLTVDVKSKKRLSKTDQNLNQEWLWVEFAGHSGLPGWLYGLSTHIAFHINEGFLLVNRQNLAEFCEKRVDLEAPTWEWASEPQDAKYKLYRRWTANEGKSVEKSALININDLKAELKTHLIKENDDG